MIFFVTRITRNMQTFAKPGTCFKLHKHRLISFTNSNAQLLHSLTIYMLHYNPLTCFEHQHAHLQEDNCIIIAADIVTLCKRLYIMPDDSILLCSLLSSGLLEMQLGYLLLCSLLSSGILYSRLQRVTIPDAVIIQFVLLKMGVLMLETCRGL